MNWYNREPPLDCLLENPLTHAVMASDRVGSEELRRILDAARERIIRAGERTSEREESADAPLPSHQGADAE